jgi:hypothetical protein
MASSIFMVYSEMSGIEEHENARRDNQRIGQNRPKKQNAGDVRRLTA